MAWLELTPDDLNGVLTQDERDKVASVLADDGTAVTRIIRQVTGQVRGYCGVKHRLGPAGTIPEELQAAALAMIRYTFLSGLPDGSLLTDDRKQANTDAVTLLGQVRDGDFFIEEDNAAAGGPGMPRISRRRREFTRETEDGI